MLSYLDLQSADGPVRFCGDGQPNRIVQKVTGLPGLEFAGPRDSTYARPSGHGSITRTRWMSAGLVAIDGVVRGANTAEVYAHLDDLSRVLSDAVDTPRLLTWQRGADGVELQAAARLAGSLDTDVVSPRIVRYHTSLRLDDPFGYLQTLSTSIGGQLPLGGGVTAPIVAPVTADPTLSGIAAVNNVGTRPTPPVFRVFGLAENPQIVLLDSGARIVLSGTIAAGDYAEIDVRAKTVRINGTSPAQGMVVSASTTWFELPRGTSTVRMLAMSNDAGARTDVLYRSAFA